jgi:hypothetical protein
MSTFYGPDNVYASAESIACMCYARFVATVVGGRNTLSLLLCDENGEPSTDFRTIPDPGPTHRTGLTRTFWCDTHECSVDLFLDEPEDLPDYSPFGL